MTRYRSIALSAGLCGLLASAACPNTSEGVKMMNAIVVESRAFRHLQPIPADFTCDGEDISPQLSWNKVPPAAKSIVIICDDPDAPSGDWVHWVVYDLPPVRDSLEQNVPKSDSIPGGGTQGMTDFGRIGYFGPCPPGGTHRYFFRVFALDIMLNLPAGKTKPAVLKAMKGHILASGELAGTYRRKR